MKSEHASNNQDNHDDRIAAYIDGEMSPGEIVAFEQRLHEDPSLRREVEEWREAIDAARDWMATPAPGIERADTLTAPLLPEAREAPHMRETPAAAPPPESRRQARVLGLPFRPLARRAIAIAAVFACGFLVGKGVNSGETPGHDQRAGANTADGQTADIQRIAPTPLPPDQGPAGTVRPERSDGSDGSGQPDADRTARDHDDRQPPENAPRPALAYATDGAKTPQPKNREIVLAPPPTRQMREQDGRLIIETSLTRTGARALWVVDGAFAIANGAAAGK